MFRRCADARRHLSRSSLTSFAVVKRLGAGRSPVVSVSGWAISPGCLPARRAFRSSADGRVTFSCLPKRKLTKEKGTPELVLGGLRPPRRELGPGFSTGLPALTKRDRHPCRSPCGPSRAQLTHRLRGPGEEQRGSRPLFHRVKAKA
jgi:hypothetical protein